MGRQGMSELDFEILDEKAVATKLEELSKLGGTARFAVAFWGRDAEDLVHLDGYDQVQIICNLRSGATNPKLIRKLLERYDVRQLDKLHAKLYWTKHGVIIGSSNASANGLRMQGKEARSLHEANVFSSNRDFITESEKRFDDLWNQSELITKADLRLVEKEYNRRKAPRKLRSPRSQHSLLKIAHRDDPLIWVCIYGDAGDPSKEAHRTFQQAEKELGGKIRNLYYYEEYEDDQRLKPGTVVVNLPIGKKGRAEDIEFMQILAEEHRPHRTFTPGKDSGKFIQLVREIRSVPGINLRILPADEPIWKKAAELFWQERDFPRKPDDQISMPLKEFSKYIRRAALLV